MADDRQSTSAAGGARGYKRSWKNLLINKKYQLRFTLFMVAVSALLMSGLGWWVMKVADEATRVQQNNAMSDRCKPAVLGLPAAAPKVAPGADDAADNDDADEATPVEPEDTDPAADAAEPTEPAPTDSKAAAVDAKADAAAADRRGGVTVEIEPMKVIEKIEIPDLVTRDGYRMKAQVTVEYVAPESETIPTSKAIRAELEPVLDDVTRARVKLTTARKIFDEGLDLQAFVQAAQDKRLADLEKAIKEADAATKPDDPTRVEAQKALAGARAAFASTIVTVRVDPPVLNPAFMAEVTTFYDCQYATLGSIRALEAGRKRILYVLIGSCLLLTLGLAVYGIKMTHKVAGPLYKITLYMGKMRDGRLDKVYNLRKGDQLVDFYEHFKTAHGGVVDLEKADIAQLKQVIAAADAAGIAGKSPEVDTALAEVKAMLARKEKALE
jgi:hypothetical protein